MVIQIFITVPFTILLSFLKLIPAATLGFDIVSVAAFFGVGVTIIDYLIGQFLVSNYRCKAAKIQEAFDCDVYEMDWDNISVGSKVQPEIVIEFGKKYKEIKGSPLTDWYPIEISGLTKEKAIFICQKTNLYYDKSLRNKFIRATTIVSLLIFGLIVTTSLIGNPSFVDFMVRIFAPFFPILFLSMKFIIEHFKAAKGLSDLHNTISGFDKSTGNPSMSDLRRVQTKIFGSRKDSPLVPDFFYNKKRQKLEESMHENAKQS